MSALDKHATKRCVGEQGHRASIRRVIRNALGYSQLDVGPVISWSSSTSPISRCCCASVQQHVAW